MHIFVWCAFGATQRPQRGNLISLLIKILYPKNSWINYFSVNSGTDDPNSSSSDNIGNTVFMFCQHYRFSKHFHMHCLPLQTLYSL